MKTLVVTVESCGESWESFDEGVIAALSLPIARQNLLAADEDRAYQSLKENLWQSPLTGYVIALGVYDVERDAGVVYYSNSGNAPDSTDGKITYKERSEAGMLAEFWEGITHYDTVVMFEGRSYGAPFLIHRSLTHGLPLTRDLMEGRYPHQQKNLRHVDLLDELTFYGAIRRRPSLMVWCRAFNLHQPSIVTVRELFATGTDIAGLEAAGNNLIATKELYEKWLSTKQVVTNERV